MMVKVQLYCEINRPVTQQPNICCFSRVNPAGARKKNQPKVMMYLYIVIVILRTFIPRDTQTMMLLCKSFVRSHLENCCPLWSPHLQLNKIQIEAVQRSFTAKIQGLRELNYWDRLHRLSAAKEGEVYHHPCLED